MFFVLSSIVYIYVLAMLTSSKQVAGGSQTSVESLIGHIPTVRSSQACSSTPFTCRGTSPITTNRKLAAESSIGQFGAVAKARRIRLYRNGDLYFNGVTIIVASDHFRTFDSLLAEVNKSAVADPAILTKVCYRRCLTSLKRR